MSDVEDRESQTVIVLDYLPHGRPDDDRPQYKKPALIHAIQRDTFHLVECVLADDADVSIGDETTVDSDEIEEVRDTTFDDLTSSARSEIEYAVGEIIDTDEQRFVDHYNEAQPITLRLHQLNLLPGIGKKLRNNILEKRKRRPFDSFEDIEDRVSGLHNPRDILVKRIHEEIREDDLKYRSFVR
jgi:putative nucleotide binding protein